MERGERGQKVGNDTNAAPAEGEVCSTERNFEMICESCKHLWVSNTAGVGWWKGAPKGRMSHVGMIQSESAQAAETPWGWSMDAVTFRAKGGT